MKRPIALALATLAAGAGVVALGGRPAHAAPSCTAVFLVPHQDDEVLGLGGAIRNHIDSGASVCVALFTNGRNSAARTSFANGFIPYAQSAIYTNSTVAGSAIAFGQARDNEFRAALTQLGVPAANVFMDANSTTGWRWNRVLDVNNSTNAANAEAFVTEAVRFFGSGKHYKTMSRRDPSPDHHLVARALATKTVASRREYWPQYQLAQKPSNMSVYPQKATTSAGLTASRYAGNHYGTFAPSSSRYGIGWLSVPQAFGGNALLVKRCSGYRTNCVGTPAIAAPNTSYLNTLHSLMVAPGTE